MRAPPFWWKPAPNGLARLLSPLGALYGAVTAWRMAQPGARIGVPVICVGNVVAGGAGKTPTAIALARALIAMGETPFFLTRGYGAPAPFREPTRIDLARHDFARTGDEAQLLARVAPTIVARNRVAGAQLAAQQGASVVVMDDGLQNPGLAKDFTLAVVDGTTGVGNGLCLPAGPLRAPLPAQAPFIDAVVLIGGSAAPATLAEKPVVSATLEPDAEAARELVGQRVFAFAGIGRPEKFYTSLRALGAVLVGVRGFPDHHPFTPGDLERLRTEAHAARALLVTTEKDQVRLPATTGVAVLPVRLVATPPEAMAGLAAAALAKARGRP